MKIKLLFLLLVSQFTLAQQRTCGMEQQMQRIMNDPIARQNYLDLQAKFEIELAKLENTQNQRSAAPAATIYVPVAVHFPDVTTPTACLKTLAQSQINVLNADYNGTNADISNWTSTVSAFYPGTNTGSLNIQFVLANQNHPAGTGLVNGDLAVTFGTDFLGGADNDSTWAGYFNLVCRDAGSGILGYSPLGGSLSNGATVVIAVSAFGSGAGCPGYVPSSPYHLGRTLTHELGHFFNLNHTFQGCTTAANCATSGDKVCDTPASNAAVYGCPAAGSVTKCSVKTLTMNYMDYTNDACMYMFTAGQATRMQAWYNTVSSTVKPNVLANNEFLATNFSITPNPNNGSFVINLKEKIDNYSIEIFDIMGRTIFEKQFNQNQNLQQTITLSNKTSGLYFVSIKSKDAVLVKKIMVE